MTHIGRIANPSNYLKGTLDISRLGESGRSPDENNSSNALIGSDCYEVIELSEEGLRFEHGTRSQEDQAKVQGIICFRDGEQQVIEGTVQRWDGKEAVMTLTQGVTFGHMIREQRYVRSNYPDVRTG